MFLFLHIEKCFWHFCTDTDSQCNSESSHNPHHFCSFDFYFFHHTTMALYKRHFDIRRARSHYKALYSNIPRLLDTQTSFHIGIKISHICIDNQERRYKRIPHNQRQFYIRIRMYFLDKNMSRLYIFPDLHNLDQRDIPISSQHIYYFYRSIPLDWLCTNSLHKYRIRIRKGVRVRKSSLHLSHILRSCRHTLHLE